MRHNNIERSMIPLVKASVIPRVIVVLVSLVPFIFSHTHNAMAADVTYQRDYSYQASEADSKISSRILALEQVKRLLLEELGSYLVGNTEVKNFQISRDQVIAITAGIVRAEILQEKWDGSTYYILAKITTDPNHVAKAIDELRNDKQSLSELEEVKKQTEDLRMGLEKLREELRVSKEREKTRATADYNAGVKKLSVSDWYNEGVILAKSRKYRDAISFYNKSIDADPMYINAYGARGWAYYQIRDFQSALRDYSVVLDLKPDSPNVLLDRAIMFILEMNQFDKAQADIDQVIKLYPDHVRAYQTRAIMHLNMHKLPKALDDCNAALKLNPNYYHTYVTRACVYREMKRYEEAFKDFQKIYDIDPNYLGLYDNRGLTYLNLKKYDEALRDFNKALEMDPYRVRARYWRGLAYYQLNKHEEAIRDFSKAIELKSDYAIAYYNRSLSYKKMGRADEAVKDLNKAAQLGDVRALRAIKK